MNISPGEESDSSVVYVIKLFYGFMGLWKGWRWRGRPTRSLTSEPVAGIFRSLSIVILLKNSRNASQHPAASSNTFTKNDPLDRLISNKWL